MPDLHLPTSPTGASAPHSFTLANGLTVLLLEDHRAPLACAQLWCHVGPSQEPAGQSGLSHALEHLVLAGSAKLPQGQYSAVMASLGASTQAFTLDDATLFSTTLPVTRLEIALEAMADLLAAARLPASAFEGVRQTLINEYRLRIDAAPDEQANRAHLRLAHGDSPYARSRFEVLADLQGLSVEQVAAWYGQHYRPDNATLIVAGAVDPATLQALVERHFAALIARPSPAPAPYRQPRSQGERRQAVHLPGLRQGLALSFNVPSLGTAPSVTTVAALRLAQTLLSQGASSRLYAALVRDQPLLRGVLGEFDLHLRGDTLFTLRALTSPGHATPEQAGERIVAIIDELAQQPIAEAELQRARTKHLAQQTFLRDALQDHAYDIARFAISGTGLAALADERTALESLGVDDVVQVAQRYLNRDHLTLTFTYPAERDQ